MAHEQLAQFQQLALADPALLRRLQAAPDRAAFVALMLEAGAARGCRFTAGDVEAALRDRRRALARAADPRDLDGWAPTHLCWQDAEPWVEWCYAGTAGFREPFFEQTIRKYLQRPFNRLFGRLTPLDELDEPHAPRPSGLILHMSRCGSTLIAQMLAALPGALVIAEAEPIDAVLRANIRDAGLSDERRAAWLRGMLGALGRREGVEQQRYFVKFDSWSILDMPLIERALPGVPWAFVYRDPLEVLVSHQRQPGSQMVPGMIEPELFGFDAASAGRMSADEYGARVLASICWAAVQHYRPGAMLVNYQQLPEAGWATLPAFFGVAPGAGDVERMRHVAQFHAKSPALYFADDRAAKQGAATERVRWLAREWLEPVYQELEALRQAP